MAGIYLNPRFVGEGILDIIDGCESLEDVALEKCRGVDREDRRRIFDVGSSFLCPPGNHRTEFLSPCAKIGLAEV